MGYGKQSCDPGFAAVRALVTGGPTTGHDAKQDPMIRC